MNGYEALRIILDTVENHVPKPQPGDTEKEIQQYENVFRAYISSLGEAELDRLHEAIHCTEATLGTLHDIVIEDIEGRDPDSKLD